MSVSLCCGRSFIKVCVQLEMEIRSVNTASSGTRIWSQRSRTLVIPVTSSYPRERQPASWTGTWSSLMFHPRGLQVMFLNDKETLTQNRNQSEIKSAVAVKIRSRVCALSGRTGSPEPSRNNCDDWLEWLGNLRKVYAACTSYQGRLQLLTLLPTNLDPWKIQVAMPSLSK